MLIAVVDIALVTWVLLSSGRDGVPVLLSSGRDGVPKSLGLAPIAGPCAGAAGMALLPGGGRMVVVLWAVEAHARCTKGFSFTAL